MSLVLSYAVRWIASGGTLLQSVVRTKDAMPKDITISACGSYLHSGHIGLLAGLKKCVNALRTGVCVNRRPNCPGGGGDAVCFPGKISYTMAVRSLFVRDPERRTRAFVACLGGVLVVSCMHQFVRGPFSGIALWPGTQRIIWSFAFYLLAGK